MFTPCVGGTSTGAGRTQTSDTTRREMVLAPFDPLFSPGSRTSAPTESVLLDVRRSLLPVRVKEVCTAAGADEQIWVKVEESGWAWLVCGGRAIIWKICQPAVCKDLQLPDSGTADHVAIVSPGPLETAQAQAVSVLAVVAEGAARFWPSLAHPGRYTDTAFDMGELCNSVVAVNGGDFIVCSYSGQLLRVSVDSSGRLRYRALKLKGHGGLLSGMRSCVSRLFGVRPPVLQRALWAGESGCLYTLTGSTLSKWEVDENSERLVFSWDTGRADEPIADALWGSVSADEMNVAYLDVKLSRAGRPVLLAAAWRHSDTPPLAHHCLVTLKDDGAAVSDCSVALTEHSPPFLDEEALRATRLVLPRASGPAAFLYNQELVFACSAAAGGERLNIVGVCGGGCCANLPVFFSRNSGLVAVLSREIASVLPGTVEDSLCSSLAAEPSSPVATPEAIRSFKASSSMDTPGNKARFLKVAFLQFCREDVAGAQTLTDELFPVEAEDELDSVVSRVSLDLVDAYPASDPRWAESVPDRSASDFHQLTSLIIIHQLEDKMKAHDCFMDFLLQVGLLDRLSQVAVRGVHMATRMLLCEHGEKLQAAAVLRNHHTKHAELLNRAIPSALRKNNSVVPPGLTPADVFFREVSRISSVLECLLEEEEKTLTNEVVVDVNDVMKDMLQAACQYRESKTSTYRPGRNAATEPEYVPWTATGGARGVRGIISRQHELILSSVYPVADPELRSVLCRQLCALLDVYFGGYVSQLSSLPRSQRERYNSLEMEYSRRRSELLARLLKLCQYQWVAALAEKYRDFDTLVELCEQTDDQSRLQSYVTAFAEQNFADFLFQWYMEKGKRCKLLSRPGAQNQQLARFLQAHQHLSWLHHVHVQDFQSAHRTLYDQARAETLSFVRKRTLLALSKLSALASDVPKDGSDVPKDGSDVPKDGSDVPKDGSDVPKDGSDVPKDGSDVPKDGSDVPKDGSDVPKDAVQKQVDDILVQKQVDDILVQKQVDDILVQERVLLHQKALPKQLLEERQMNPDVMPVLAAHELIRLYICDDNRQADEHDFQKALELLEYVDEEEDGVDVNTLKCHIFGKALAKDNWSSADGTDDPLDAATDTVFVRILLDLIQEGVSLQTYLPDIRDLLDLDELASLKSKPSFEFALRANYEYYVKKRSLTT